MPIYEYRCAACGNDVEALQKMADAPLRKCPECGKSQLKRLVSAPQFRLKGGGWYETDFKGDKENKRNLAVDKEPDTSSDSKPAKPVAGGDAKADAKSGDAKPAESKSSDSGSASSSGESSGGSSSGSGSSSGEGSRKGASASRSSSASKSRAKAPPSRSPAKSKAKPAARRKGR